MTRAGVISAVVFAVMQAAAPVMAQNLRDAGPPAEFPPSDYSGNQYVDSRGCVYVRAGIGGTVDWVPRVNRQREVLCGFQPTLAPVAEPPAAPETTTAEAPAEEPAPVEVAAAEPAPTPAPVTAPPTRTRSTPPPGFTPPRTIITPGPSSTAVAPAAPLGISRIAGTSAIAAPQFPQEAEETPAPARLTRSEFCEGRFGIQPGYISSRTGQAVDCGPRPAATPAVLPQSTGPEPRRVTRAEICAEIRETGRQFINAATGLPVRCPADEAAIQMAEAMVPPPAATVASNCANISGISAQYVPSGANVRCGPQAQDPVFGGTTTRATNTRVSTKTARNPFAPPPVPASNPTFAVDPDPAPPAGYQRVWDDGRLNPNRGLPARSTATQLVPEHVSSRAPAPPSVTAPSHPYVAVATYRSADQAQSAARTLRSQGLPMRIAVFERDGQQYRIVLAGPFSSQSGLDSAMGKARGAGFGNARPANY